VIPRAIAALFLTIALLFATYPGFVWLSTASSATPSPVPWVKELFGGGSMFSSGRFASMTKVRDEASIHVLRCKEESDCEDDQQRESLFEKKCMWVEVDVACKVGSVSRKPCFTSPLHRRFAWQWWFLGLRGDTRWLELWLQKLRRGEPEAWFSLEADDDETWTIRAVTVRMHRYEWNMGKPQTDESRTVGGYGLIDRADGLWWSRSSGRELMTVQMATKWQRRTSKLLGWWGALVSWLARGQHPGHKAAVLSVLAELRSDGLVWLDSARTISMTRIPLLQSLLRQEL